MNLQSGENNFRFVDKVQNKIKRNCLYGYLVLPMTNDPKELERLESELNTEMEIYETFFKPIKHREN